MELVWIVIAYLAVTAAVGLWMVRSVRRKRRKAWEVYYDNPDRRSRRTTRRRR